MRIKSKPMDIETWNPDVACITCKCVFEIDCEDLKVESFLNYSRCITEYHSPEQDIRVYVKCPICESQIIVHPPYMVLKHTFDKHERTLQEEDVICKIGNWIKKTFSFKKDKS